MNVRPHHTQILVGKCTLLRIFNEFFRVLQRHKINKVILTRPSEYHDYQQAKQWSNQLSLEVEIHSADRFLCMHEEFA